MNKTIKQQTEYAEALVDTLDDETSVLDLLDALAVEGLMLVKSESGNPASEAYMSLLSKVSA